MKEQISHDIYTESRGNAMWKREYPRGGSLTVEYRKNGGIVADTLGQLAAVPLRHLPYWTPDDVFKKPTKREAEIIYERWKGVPWKGDTLVHIGGTSIWEETARTFQIGGINGRPNIFLRTLYYPGTLLNSIWAKVTRNDYYNPMTKAVFIHHPNTDVAMQETGVARRFDEMDFPGLWTVAKDVTPWLGPAIDGLLNYEGMNIALGRYKYDKDAANARKIFEPLLGAEMVEAILPWSFDITNDFNIGRALGFTSGHITSRLTQDMGRYGWIFKPRT